MSAGSLDYLVGPVVAVTMIALLAVFLRWAFGSSKPAPRRPTDDGLLTRVATLSRRETALALRAVLSDGGIRSTIRMTAAHRADVLVFPEDAARASVLVSTFSTG